MGWGLSCKGSVGPVVIVEVLEGFDPFGDFIDAHGQIGAGVELVSPCAVAALDGAVELWRSGRQDVEGQVFVGAGLFELGLELGAAVDLDGFDGLKASPGEPCRESWRRSWRWLVCTLATVHLANGS